MRKCFLVMVFMLMAVCNAHATNFGAITFDQDSGAMLSRFARCCAGWLRRLWQEGRFRAPVVLESLTEPLAELDAAGLGPGIEVGEPGDLDEFLLRVLEARDGIALPPEFLDRKSIDQNRSEVSRDERRCWREAGGWPRKLGVD
jgi:hypothetical protein